MLIIIIIIIIMMTRKVEIMPREGEVSQEKNIYHAVKDAQTLIK